MRLREGGVDASINGCHEVKDREERHTKQLEQRGHREGAIRFQLSSLRKDESQKLPL